ncbi:MAG: formylglycine-generating enzyme family protein [Polyangiaceae bacterium]|nr:formylglycine-generating enzyme family protein [Polyangiaceae bacterium]
MVAVGPAILKAFDPPTPEEANVKVARFFLDKTPVTNRDFLAFVTNHQKWRRDSIPRLFADAHYLMDWASPTEPGPRAPENAPVVRVSWFAAKAYCASRGLRLPTENEWELAAAADENSQVADPDARRTEILAWYAEPTPAIMPAVGKKKPNFWGLYDMHSLVWEWVLDFNNRTASDGRRTDEAFVCGGSSLRGSDKYDYGAYMRFAFRASLRGDYTTANLGFRCARDTRGARDMSDTTKKGFP